MVVHGSCGNMTGPAYDEGNTNTTLQARALLALQFAVAAEEVGVSSAFLVRTVVRREDDDGVFVQSLGFQLGHDFAHIGVEAGDHCSKLGVGVDGGMIAVNAGKCLVVAELAIVGLKDGVVGLVELGVGKSVGEETVERFVG